MSLGDILDVLPTIAVGLLMFYWQRKQTRRDAQMNDRAAARKRESLLSLQMMMAGNKLSYAVAMAVRRGKPNGEVEEAITAYKEARTAYTTFLNEQAADHITEG